MALEYEAEREKERCEERKKEEQKRRIERDFQMELKKIMEAEKVRHCGFTILNMMTFIVIIFITDVGLVSG